MRPSRAFDALRFARLASIPFPLLDVDDDEDDDVELFITPVELLLLFDFFKKPFRIIATIDFLLSLVLLVVAVGLGSFAVVVDDDDHGMMFIVVVFDCADENITLLALFVLFRLCDRSRSLSFKLRISVVVRIDIFLIFLN